MRRAYHIAFLPSSFPPGKTRIGPRGDISSLPQLTCSARYFILFSVLCLALFIGQGLPAEEKTTGGAVERELPDKIRLHYESAMRLAGKWEYGDAVKELDKALEMAPDFKLAAIYRGLFEQRAGLVPQVKEQEDAVKRGPDDAKALYNLGLLWMNLGNFERAFEILQRACRIDGDSDPIRKALAEAYDRRRLWSEFIGPFRKEAVTRGYMAAEAEAVQEKEKPSLLLEEKRRVKEKVGEWLVKKERRREEALRGKEKVERRIGRKAPEPPDSYQLLTYGICLYRAGEYREASLQLKKALKKNPSLEMARAWLKIISKRESATDNIKTAEEDIRNYYKKYGVTELGAGYYRLGKLLMEVGDYDLAFDEFRYAYELNRESDFFKKGMNDAYDKKVLWNKYLEELRKKDKTMARWGTPGGIHMHLLEEDKHIIYSMKPNIDTSSEQVGPLLQNSVVYKTNSLGLRNEEIDDPKKPGVYRILVLGDSITFGDNISRQKTYPRQLEKILNENPRPGGIERYEVINAGVRSYSTYMELGYFRKRGVLLDPDMVIVGFCYNDVGIPDYLYDKHTLEVLGEIPGGSIPNLERMTWWREFSLTKQIARQADMRRLRAEEHCETLVEALTDYFSPEWVWLRRQLDGIEHIAARRGIRMVFVTFPLKWQLEGGKEYIKPHELMRKYCHSRGITMVDLGPVYEKEGTAVIFGSEGDNFLHPTELGYIIAAEEIFREIGTPELPLRRRLIEKD
ncbi:MAG: tetratricopeptide repeat protein [Candidatus Tritonobacter lacicola]|nr:tetratricopeptide repeat protein [Candidatus Tritonobacter lacicola]